MNTFLFFNCSVSVAIIREAIAQIEDDYENKPTIDDNKSFQNDLLITMNQETFSNVQRQPTFR